VLNASRQTAGVFGLRKACPPNKGEEYPAEPLTPAEVTAIIGQCSRTAPTGTVTAPC
jgi:hypothetical protein